MQAEPKKTEMAKAGTGGNEAPAAPPAAPAAAPPVAPAPLSEIRTSDALMAQAAVKMAIHIKDGEDLKTRLQEAGDKLVVIDFMATWCGPCKMIGPKLEELAQEMIDCLVVLKVDVDECEDIATEYNINSMPTFVFVKNNKKIEEFSGANVDKLKNTILKLK